VAFKEDLDLLAASATLLAYLLETFSTPEQWKWPASKLAAKLAAPLKKPFQEAVAQQLREGRLPPAFGGLTIKNKPQLFLRRLAPAEAQPLLLAGQLVDRLVAWRPQSDYPPTLEQLRQALPEPVDTSLLQQSLTEAVFKARVLVAVPGNLAAPVAVVEDVEQLADSPALLHFLLSSCESAENQAPALKAMKKILTKKLQAPFEQAVRARIDFSGLPADTGCLKISKQDHLFFLHHIQRHQPRTEAPPALPATAPKQPSFEQAFAAAFDQLNRQDGAHNFVSLVALRQVLPWDRATFDAELLRLRRQGRYTLSAAEGRHGIGPEQQAAGILEEGSLLLFVSKNDSPEEGWFEIP
jgi:hypothetical protein